MTYDPHPRDRERLLVYDLGGGTFDVSVAQVEQGVVEILSSHGDTQLGGDDFDQLLLDLVCNSFNKKYAIDLRQSPPAKARLLHAVEEVKKRLSFEAVAAIEEEFIATKENMPLHLNMEIIRAEYEEMIRPLLMKTLHCLDQGLTDAGLQATEIDKVVLVGGATRTPLIHQLLEERLGRPVHSEIEPDLAVALGAAVQGGLIAGVEVGPILVDITPHTLGIKAIGDLHGFMSSHHFSPIIHRNTPLPASRTEIYSTVCDGQKSAQIRVYQGENEDIRFNTLVGEFLIEGLADVPAGNDILVRLDLDLSGILQVTATERATGLVKRVTIDNATERFRVRRSSAAADRLEAAFETVGDLDGEFLGLETPVLSLQGPAARHIHEANDQTATMAPSLRYVIETANKLAKKAEHIIPIANDDDASELRSLLGSLRSAIERKSTDEIEGISREIEDLVFYLEDK